MGTYTDAKHLDVREAMERLPKLTGQTPNETATTFFKPPTKPQRTVTKWGDLGHLLTMQRLKQPTRDAAGNEEKTLGRVE